MQQSMHEKRRTNRRDTGQNTSITMQTIGGTRFKVSRKAPGWNTVHGTVNGTPVNSPRIFVDSGCKQIGLATTNPNDGAVSMTPNDIAVAAKYLSDRGLIDLNNVTTTSGM